MEVVSETKEDIVIDGVVHEEVTVKYSVLSWMMHPRNRWWIIILIIVGAILAVVTCGAFIFVLVKIINRGRTKKTVVPKGTDQSATVIPEEEKGVIGLSAMFEDENGKFIKNGDKILITFMGKRKEIYRALMDAGMFIGIEPNWNRYNSLDRKGRDKEVLNIFGAFFVGLTRSRKVIRYILDEIGADKRTAMTEFISDILTWRKTKVDVRSEHYVDTKDIEKLSNDLIDSKIEENEAGYEPEQDIKGMIGNFIKHFQ